MSRTDPSDGEQAELIFECHQCQAASGQWCRSTAGNDARYLHASRWDAVMAVIKLSGWAAEEEAQRRLIIRLRRGIREIRDLGQRDVRNRCDELLAAY